MTEASDNKLMKRFDELLEKLIKSVEGLNGVTVNGISVMAKSIAQESMSIDQQKTKRKAIAAELKISATQLAMKEKLKGVDEHLVRLRHKLKWLLLSLKSAVVKELKRHQNVSLLHPLYLISKLQRNRRKNVKIRKSAYQFCLLSYLVKKEN